MAGTMIFVVSQQNQNFMDPGSLTPVQAYSDYPTAFAFAQTIYVNQYTDPNMSAKDLIFMIPMNGAGTASVSGT